MHRFHTTIVGAGIIGLATAYALLRQNVKVTLVEQAHINHRYSSSRGLSRLLRFEYGSDALYSNMVQASLERWHALEDTAHQQLFTQTGLLALGSDHDEEIKSSYNTLCSLGYTLWKLSPHECQ